MKTGSLQDAKIFIGDNLPPFNQRLAWKCRFFLIFLNRFHSIKDYSATNMYGVTLENWRLKKYIEGKSKKRECLRQRH